MWLLGEFHSTCNRIGIIAQKRADEVLLLLDASFQVGYVLSCKGDQLFRLSHVEHGADPAVCQRTSKLQRLLARTQGSARDLKLKVVRTKLEIRGGNIAYQCVRDCTLCPLGCQQIGTGRLRGSAVLAPEIEVPGH